MISGARSHPAKIDRAPGCLALTPTQARRTISLLLTLTACRAQRTSVPEDGGASSAHPGRPRGEPAAGDRPVVHKPPRHVYSERPRLRWCEVRSEGHFRIELSPAEQTQGAPVTFMTDSCAPQSPVALTGGTWTWRVFDRDDGAPPRALATQEIVVHPTVRGAIVAAPDLDVDGDGLRDPAFLSVQREGRGAAVATVTVAFGSPRGFARVETHALDVSAETLSDTDRWPFRWPFLARLGPLHDAPERDRHLYLVDLPRARNLVIALHPARDDTGAASWEARVVAEESLPGTLPSGDLDGDGTGDLVVHPGVRENGPRRVMADDDAARDGSLRVRVAPFPHWRPPSRALDCPPAGDSDGDGSFELACQTIDPTSGYRQWITLSVDDGRTWTPGRLVPLPSRERGWVSAVGDVSGDGAGDWVVESSSSPPVYMLLTDLHASVPRVHRLIESYDPSSIMYGRSFPREECLTNLYPHDAIVAVGDLNGDGRNDLAAISRTPCPDVPWKFTRFLLDGDTLRVERQLIAFPSHVSSNGIYIGTGITEPGRTEVFHLGDSRSNLTRLRTMRVWRFDPRTQRLEPL